MRRILFEIPLPGGSHLPIHAFGVLAAAGFLAALWAALDRGRREKLAEAVMWDVWTASLLGGLAGARLFYVIEQWDFFVQAPAQMFAIWRGGLVWYGGVAGALVAVLLYLRYRRQPALAVIDAVTPATMIGLAFGRIGCFLNGCCFGGVTGLPWGVCYPRDGGAGGFHSALAHELSPPFAYQVDTMHLDPMTSASLPVHPTQLYESAAALLIFLLLTAYYPRRRRPGEVFWLMLILYGTARFFIEMLRTNAAVVGGLSLAQVMSLVVVPIALGFFIRSRGRPGLA
jgi:phosphatidylglycerol:prolipoprotein diacylglycerol transferase